MDDEPLEIETTAVWTRNDALTKTTAVGLLVDGLQSSRRNADDFVVGD